MDLFDIVISGKIRKEGGGDVSVDALSVAENGVYTAEEGHAYSPVTVSVPQGVFPSGTLSIASNGTYDVGSFASADVNVSGGGGGISIDDIAMRTISGVVSGSATNIEAYAFASCAFITGAYFPNVTGYISSNAFYQCHGLTAISFPNANCVGPSAFQGCRGLSTAIFPKVSSVLNYAFNGCTALASVYLLSSVKVSMINSNAFNNTPIATSSHLGSFGSIYVPASLVSAYKQDTKWSFYADRITSYVEG